GLEVPCGIDQRLALDHAGAGGRDVHRVRREPLLRELEGDARTRGSLEEQIDDRLAAQDRNLLDRQLADLLERPGRVQDREDLIGIELLQPDQVLAQVRSDRGHTAPSPDERSSTARRPPSSGTSTSTRWPD